MKIEYVSFDNINSLCGHFEVDFTHPSLTDPGIFVITGPTGVGKTSLLDAVSFALYGRTARQKGVSGERDELMTRGAPFCRAELRFEKDGRRYIVATEHRRKRSGVGFGQQERKLERMEDDGTVSTLATQVKEVGAQVEAITGLGFENFFRCMMLAQGRFAQFLEADAADRSKVLATITGTEIYQTVGEVVSAHKAELEKALADIRWQEVMPPEQRALKEERLAAAVAEKEAAIAARNATENALRWLGDVVRAQGNLADKLAALELAGQAVTAFTADGSAEKLRAAGAALAVRPFHVQLLEARKNESAEREIFTHEGAWLESHRAPLQQAEAAEQAAAGAWEKESPGIEASLQRLVEVVRPLENQVRLAQVAEAAAHGQAEAAARESTAAAGKRAAAKSALEKAGFLAASAAAAFQNLAADAALGEDLPAIRQRLKDWASAPGAEADLPDHDTLLARQEELCRATGVLLAGRREDELPLLAERMKHLADRDQEEKEALAAMARAQAAESAAQKAFDGLESVDDAEKIFNTCVESTKLAAQVASLEDRLNTLYLDFRDGKYPCCPCCGSPVPHERKVEANALKLRQREEKAASDELTRRRKAADAAIRALALAKSGVEGARRELSVAADKRAAALAALGWQEIPADLEQRRSACAADMGLLAGQKRESAALASLLALDTLRGKCAECLRPWCAEPPAGLSAARLAVKSLEKRLKAYRDAEKTAQQAADGKARAALALEHAERAAADAAGKAKAAAHLAQQAADALAGRRERLAEAHTGDPSEKVEQALRTVLKKLQDTRDATRKAAEALRQEQLAHQTSYNGAAARLPERANARQQAEGAFAAALGQAAFPDEPAYTAACAFIPERDALQQRHQALTDALNTCRGATEEARQALDKLRAQSLTEKTAEELEAEFASRHALCHEKEEFVTTLRTLLLKDDDALRANREKEAEAAGLKQQLNDWAALFEILGGTKDGFKKYAQQITFDILVQHANRQLRTLSERYTLISDPEQDLALRVLDSCRDEEAGRSCSNLSGGESFIVSLALALGLSRMAGSKTRIDTLFLDEGFGTLDDASLERVLAGLQNLRASGKLVGIISHVEKLQARIPANIALEPRGGTGLSTFRPHEAVVAAPALPAQAHAPTKAALRQAEAEAARRQAILRALAAGPLIEKDIALAIGIPRGNRAVLKALVAAGLLLYDKPYYRLS